MKHKEIKRSILPAPNMNYSRIHLVIAYCIMALSILGVIKVIELIRYFI